MLFSWMEHGILLPSTAIGISKATRSDFSILVPSWVGVNGFLNNGLKSRFFIKWLKEALQVELRAVRDFSRTEAEHSIQTSTSPPRGEYYFPLHAFQEMGVALSDAGKKNRVKVQVIYFLSL